MIKAVIFDIDDTLYDFKKLNAEAVQQLSEYVQKELGIKNFPALYKAALKEQFRLHGNTAGCHSRAIRAQMILEDLHLPLRYAPILNDMYWHYFEETMQPFDGAQETFRAIKQRDITIGICTNMTADWQLKKLAKLSLIDYCDFIVSSEEAAAEKPSPQIYALCVEKAKVPPASSLFIGDNPTCDYQGAIDFGMGALLFAPNADEETRNNYHTITNLGEILSHLN